MFNYFEFRFKKGSHKRYAFANMGRPDQLFTDASNLQFSRALGMGSGNGFSIIPSFSKYAILFIDDKSLPGSKEELPEIVRDYMDKAESYMAVSGLAVKSHGQWGGINPFPSNGAQIQSADPIAVITRATIRTSRLIEFWLNVPKTSKFMYNHPAAIHQSGIGEYPLFMQATFSLWKSKEELYKAAYSNTVHAEIVKKTRERKWYKEELFAEFKPLHIDFKGPEYEKLSIYSDLLRSLG